FSSRRRHTRFKCDWSSDVCSSDLELSLASGLESTKANIRRLMVSTSGWTSGPVNRQRISPRTECFVESLGKRDGAAFRFDESKIAVVRADASHHVAQKGRRARRELLEQGFGKQPANGVCGNM